MFQNEKLKHKNDGKVITAADLLAPTGSLTDKEKAVLNNDIEKLNIDPAAARAYKLGMVRRIIEKIRSL